MKDINNTGPLRLSLWRPIKSSFSFLMKSTYAMNYLSIFFLCFLFARTEAQMVDIPDTNFLSALVHEGVDTNGDGMIQVSEAEAVMSLNVEKRSIDSLDGLSSFVNLETLIIRENNVNSIHLEGLSKLKNIQCDKNNLPTIDLSHTPLLQGLNCGSNNLSTIDLSHTPLLQELKCYFNNLSMLDLSHTPLLEVLHCGSNNLSTIDLRQVPLLQELNCHSNNLYTLDLSHTPLLELLYCRHSSLSTLDLSHTPLLEELSCSYNSLSTIDLSHTPLLEELGCISNSLPSLDLKHTPLLERLWCLNNNLSTLDLSHTPLLVTLSCGGNDLSTLDLSHTPLLHALFCDNNNLPKLDLSQIPILGQLTCDNNNLSNLDLGHTPLLWQLECDNNNLLTLDLSSTPKSSYLRCSNNNLNQLILKNGNTAAWSTLDFNGNPDLQYVCTDEDDLTLFQQILDDYGQPDVILNTYCSFDPGGHFAIIEGKTIYDLNNNGCDTTDIAYPYLKLLINVGAEDYYLISSQTGEYNIPVADGDYTIKPLLENTVYFNANPGSFQVSFPTDSSPFIQDICIIANGVHHDVDVVIIPITPARPGFNSSYKIQYQNMGTTIRSGHLSFSFDDNLMDLNDMNQAADTSLGGYLSWSYADLLPFESRSITVSFELNTPLDMPPLNGNDVLDFTASIYPIADDETPADNIFMFAQTVVNSFDPNDKTCLEGNIIKPEMVGEYVHYMVRFENTGTASAVNIVVKDVIDTAVFDLSTLYITDASHDLVTRITDENIVEFIFEDIYLEFDDAINDGYVVFKIKTKSDLVIGDQLTNSAEIYFDFNAPILTNQALSTIDNNSAVIFAPTLESRIRVYPNPFDEMIQISAKGQIQRVHIIDAKGNLMQTYQYDNMNTARRISTLAYPAGLYLLEVVTSEGVYLEKVVK